MAPLAAVPRRCVNLPPGSLGVLVGKVLSGQVREGPDLEPFHAELARWLGVPHVFGASSGRSAFQLALQALDLPAGAEIIFPAFTFPVMPMVAQILGYKPVFCAVDLETYNSGPEHIAARITERTGAVLATHLFGRPCPIEEIAELARQRSIRLMEDCAHACGVRVGGKQVGTFGDIGVFSFAQGKNMPCFGGGAIATADEEIATRARKLVAETPIPPAAELRSEAISVWIKWLLTRPLIFGLSAYPVLRLKLAQGKPLMDSEVGDELLARFQRSNPRFSPIGNIQAALGRVQLRNIDAFNAGARRNGEILTRELSDVPGIRVPPSGGDHIFVYYPIAVEGGRRDELRDLLLRHGVDTKTSDMADCGRLETFRGADAPLSPGQKPLEASVLEICVYPAISEGAIRRIARVIRGWAGLAPTATRASGITAG
jgi:dTDP-4-amino-4,6-dideoxygalactose transaminase